MAAAAGVRDRLEHSKRGQMSETILIGRGKHITTIPRSNWEQELHAAPELIRQRLDFMSPDHHAVRNFVVRELPTYGKPFSIKHISHALRLPRERTAQIVGELERNRFGDRNLLFHTIERTTHSEHESPTRSAV
jgi:hypothetical protein